MDIKKGDIVRVSKDAPKIYLMGWYGFTCNVIDIEDSHAKIECNNCVLVLPTKYLIKVDAEAKEAKFKYQVGQKVILHFYGGEVSTIIEAFRDGGVWNKYKVKALPHHIWNENELDPYIEPTEQTEAKKNDADNLKKEAEEWANTVSNAIKEYGDVLCQTYIDAHNEACWDAYAADLAKELVVKIASRDMNNDPDDIAEHAVLIAKAVVEGLKRK